ncbi:MAG: hypothetical protein K5696_04310 [Lachnospiraceae bacterium]|nr:hypothetical protein [Lachnospiraceae bacterium]
MAAEEIRATRVEDETLENVSGGFEKDDLMKMSSLQKIACGVCEKQIYVNLNRSSYYCKYCRKTYPMNG